MKPNMLTKLSFSLFLLIAAAACSKKDSGPISTLPPSNQPPASTPDPVAIFSLANTDMRAPVKIKFKNTSQNADTYLWQFSDGTTSTEKEPEKVFMRDGTFKVTLTVTGAGGKTDSKTSDMTIEKAPDIMDIKQISVIAGHLNGDDDGTFLEDPDPDIYLWITNGVSIFRTPVVQNAISLSELSWTTNYAIPLRQGTILGIEMYDNDTFSTDDNLGSVRIQLADYRTINHRYPEEITATVNGMTLKLKVSWRLSPN